MSQDNDWEDIPTATKDDDWEDVSSSSEPANPWAAFPAEASNPAALDVAAPARSEPVSFNSPAADSYKPASKSVKSLVDDIKSTDRVLGRSVGQGVTLGFRDEAVGAMEAPLDAIQDYANYYFGNGGKPEGLIASYKQARDEQRRLDTEAQLERPELYDVGTMLGASVLPGSSIKSLVAQGTAQGLGSSEYDLTEPSIDNALGAAKDTAVGGGVGAAIGVAGKGFSGGFERGGKALKREAEKLAENATGATRVGAEKFSEGTGRKLLDRGIVGFGDTPVDIARKAAEQKQAASKAIGEALKELDAQGGQVTINDVVVKLSTKAQELSQIPGNEPIVKQLITEAENLMNNYPPTLPISQAEAAKRAYQGRTNYNSPVADQKATKHAAQAFREAGEDAATQVNPELSKQFKEAKDTYGMLTPVEDAAAKRASQLNQSPFGGLLDVAALGGGGAAFGGLQGGVAGAVTGTATAAARRFASPRIGSSLAVAADKAGDFLKAAPQVNVDLGKYVGEDMARNLQSVNNAAQRGVVSLAARKGAEENSPTGRAGDALADTLNTNPQLFGRWAPALQKAVERGGSRSLAATSYALAARDPEFKRVLARIMNSNPEDINADNMER
jgi:hypothetical protein